MRSPFRIAAVVLGLYAVVYGVASLTGRWLRTPPWWEVERAGGAVMVLGEPDANTGKRHVDDWRPFRTTDPRPGREWISGGVVAAGLALAAFGAWPRRRGPVS